VSRAFFANFDQIESFSDSDVDGILDTVVFKETYTLADVTNANPAIVETTTNHTYNNGDIILFVGTSPMDGLIAAHVVGNVIDATHFELTGFDSTLLAPYAGTVATVQNGAFYEYEFHKDTASFTSELQVQNGNKYYLHNVGVQLANLEQAAKDQMDQLGLARIVSVVVTRSGKWLIAGKDNGLESSALSLNAGQAAGDFAGYQFTLTGEELENPPEWDNTIVGLPLFT